VLLSGCHLHIEIDTGHISASSPIVLKEDLSELHFVLEGCIAAEHTVVLSLSGLPAAAVYGIYADNERVALFDNGETTSIHVRVVSSEATITIKREQSLVAAADIR
jgi:hypothetical protein